MSEVAWFPVLPGQSIRAAINAAATATNGGIVYLAPGEHLVPASGDPAEGLLLPYPWGCIYPDTTPPPQQLDDWYYNPLKPISLLGDGANSTIIRQASGFAGPLLLAQRPFSTISGITFDGAGLTSGPVVEIAGVVLNGRLGNTRRINFRDVIIRNGLAQCLKISGGDSSPISILNSFERCVFANNGATALVEIQAGVTTQEFRNCHFTSFRGSAVLLRRSQGISFYDSLFDSAAVYGPESFLKSEGAQVGQIFNCTFDEGTTPTQPGERRWCIELSSGAAGSSSHGWSIVGCLFIRRSVTDGGPAAILIGTTDMPCFGIAIVDPVVRMPAGSTVLVPQIRIQNPVANADLSNQSQVVVLGGYSEVGDPSSPTKKFLDIDDHSAKTAWIGHRQWRVPQTAIGSPLPTGLRLGDMVARPGGGLEAFSEREIPSASESWIPTTVNRYKDQATLDALDPGSINLGTLVWVDDISALRVCTKLDPLTWKTVAWT